MSKRQISLEDKKKIIDAITNGEKQVSVCKRLNLPKSTVNTIVKRKAEVLNAYEDDENSRKNKRMRKAAYPELEEALQKWMQQARASNLPITGPLLKAKAAYFSMKMGHDDFDFSNGWLDRFKKRKGVVFKVVTGESAGVSTEIVNDWKVKLTEIIKDYDRQDIFNMDESALFYKMKPGQTLTFKADKCQL
ncbi:TIGD4 (predicted) [Pycnogonum litorale]